MLVTLKKKTFKVKKFRFGYDISWKKPIVYIVLNSIWRELFERNVPFCNFFLCTSGCRYNDRTNNTSKELSIFD